MPNPTQVPITPPRIPFINPETGYVAQPWYLFLLSLNQLTSGSNVSLGDVQKGPPTLTIDEVNDVVSKATDNLAPSQDGLLAQIAELQKQVDGQDLCECCNTLIGQLAELQKQVDGLAQQPVNLLDQLAELQKQVESLSLQVQPQLGTMSSQNTGATGNLLSADVPPRTITVVNGIITSIV